MVKEDKKLRLPDGFCDGCCYNNNPKPELNCKKIKCCYLVKRECILINGCVYPVID